MEPVKVNVEYCGKCNFKSQCLELVTEVRAVCPTVEITCTEGRRGSFEVTVNDTLIHSKLAQLAFPSNKDVAKNVQNASEGKPLQKVEEQPITDCTIQ